MPGGGQAEKNIQEHSTQALSDQHLQINMISSFTAGTICAAVFHPWDRALFLAIDNKRAFCLKANFTRPFHGLGQSICYKPLSNSIYYFVQGEMQETLYPYLRRQQGWSENSAQCAVGFFAGGIEGFLKNPLSAIKANTWKNGRQGSFLQSSSLMWTNGGWKSFTNGGPAGISRDIIFGAAYEPIRKNMRCMLKQSKLLSDNNTVISFTSDITGAAIGTVLCSPLNYARTMQYRTTPGEKPPTIRESVSSIVKDTLEKPTFREKLSFFQRRLCIGWGTARVAVGMATGQMVSDQVKKGLKNIESRKFKK